MLRDFSFEIGCKITHYFSHGQKKFYPSELIRSIICLCTLKKVQFPRDTAPLKYLEINQSTLVAISIRELPLQAMNQFDNAPHGRV